MLAKGYSSMIRRRKRDVGVCNYSAYMGEGSVITKKPGTDELVTRKEWDEFVKHVYALATTRREGSPAKVFTSNKSIIIDSGASHHMISDRHLLRDIKTSSGGVKIANGDMVPI